MNHSNRLKATIGFRPGYCRSNSHISVRCIAVGPLGTPFNRIWFERVVFPISLITLAVVVSMLVEQQSSCSSKETWHQCLNSLYLSLRRNYLLKRSRNIGFHRRYFFCRWIRGRFFFRRENRNPKAILKLLFTDCLKKKCQVFGVRSEGMVEALLAFDGQWAR